MPALTSLRSWQKLILKNNRVAPAKTTPILSDACEFYALVTKYSLWIALTRDDRYFLGDYQGDMHPLGSFLSTRLFKILAAPLLTLG